MTVFDVTVIGGGHAGIEAALAASRTGSKVLLLTMSIDKIGEMSCNPSIGGQAKGQIVREIDILGGIMGRAADFASIQYRVLNRRKGPAVQALRSQSDKKLYSSFIIDSLFSDSRITILQGEAVNFTKTGDDLFLLTDNINRQFLTKTLIVTAGTFLDGEIKIGDLVIDGGRLGEKAANNLTETLVSSGHRLIRLKTGTPVRISGKSIDFSKMEIQPGETDYSPFSIRTAGRLSKQIPCYLTRTTNATKKIILDNLHLSPIYGHNKSIHGVGPRYCPSIEDKFVKFPDKEFHQIFAEPEGWNCLEYYPNGISTSLPFDIQKAMLSTIPGFENSIITRPAYAIEYNAFDPTDLKLTLESKFISGLFFAGQVNGTSGYEEAAGQGLVAGVNASLFALNKLSDFILSRTDSYIGVLISDITSKGVDEPYRMFTSRLEYRLHIRDNNAPERLLDISDRYNLIDKNLIASENRKIFIKKHFIKMFDSTTLFPDKHTNEILADLNEQPLNKPVTVSALLRRTTVDRNIIEKVFNKELSVSDEIWSRIEVEIKYSGFLQQELDEIKKFKDLLNIRIPSGFDYSKLSGLTNEAKQKLSKISPENLSQASTIPGITPAAISILLLNITKITHEKE